MSDNKYGSSSTSANNNNSIENRSTSTTNNNNSNSAKNKKLSSTRKKLAGVGPTISGRAVRIGGDGSHKRHMGKGIEQLDMGVGKRAGVSSLAKRKLFKEHKTTHQPTHHVVSKKHTHKTKVKGHTQHKSHVAHSHVTVVSKGVVALRSLVVHPPLKLGLVQNALYRSKMITEDNLAFIMQAGVGIVVNLSVESPSKPVLKFLKNNHIHLEKVGIRSFRDSESWEPLNLEVVISALEVVLKHVKHVDNNQLGPKTKATRHKNIDNSNNNNNSTSTNNNINNNKSKTKATKSSTMLVMCASGYRLTGAVFGCLRKLQNWTFSSIADECRRFAGRQNIYQTLQFIESFDLDFISVSCGGMNGMYVDDGGDVGGNGDDNGNAVRDNGNAVRDNGNGVRDGKEARASLKTSQQGAVELVLQRSGQSRGLNALTGPDVVFNWKKTIKSLDD